MLHLSTETGNNEQVSKVFKQNFTWDMRKNGLFWYLIVYLKIAKRWGSLQISV